MRTRPMGSCTYTTGDGMDNIAKPIIIAIGQRWSKRKDESPGSYWTVVSLSSEGHVGLSGPGPCRSYQIVQDYDLINGWVRTQ